MAASAIVPPLHALVPMYRRMKTFTEFGDLQALRQVQTVALSPAEAEAARRTKEGVPSAVVRSIALVRLSNVSILGNTGSIIDERERRVFRTRRGRDRVSYHELRAEPTTRIVKGNANYLNMLGPHKSHRHYFHFLIDYLPRIHYFLEHFDTGRDPVVVLVNEDLSPLQEAIFDVLARRHPHLRFERVPRSERWVLPALYQIDDYQSAPEIPGPVQRTFMAPDVVAFLRETVFAAYRIQPPLGGERRLYVSRNDTRKRRLLNEDALAGALRRNGFEIVMPGTLTNEEQAALFAQARVICGPHGAGLTNLLFAPPGAHVIEILPANRTIAAYLMLAKSAGHTYQSIVGTPEVHHQHFTCDAGRIIAALDALAPQDRKAYTSSARLMTLPTSP